MTGAPDPTKSLQKARQHLLDASEAGRYKSALAEARAAVSALIHAGHEPLANKLLQQIGLVAIDVQIEANYDRKQAKTAIEEIVSEIYAELADLAPERGVGQ